MNYDTIYSLSPYLDNQTTGRSVNRDE